jgi:anti-sigma factor RsiW
MSAERDRQHELVFESLPFYANGTLNRQETARVETHLEGCLSCRTELARWRDVAAAARSGPGWSPSSADWAAMEARIDRADGPVRDAGHGWWETVRSWFAISPPPMRWALATQAALVLVLGGALLLRPAGTKVYETLSTPERAVPSGRARLHVVFAEDATERDIRTALQEWKAVIVGGPSATGIYTVELPFATSERALVEEAAGKAKANAKIRFAAPAE